MKMLRVVLVTLVSVFAGQVWADSSAGATQVPASQGVRIELVDLRPDDGIDPEFDAKTNVTYSVLACLHSSAASECIDGRDFYHHEKQTVSLAAAYGSVVASNRDGVSGQVVMPVLGLNAFNGDAAWSYGALVSPWTSATFSVEVELYATGDLAWAEAQFGSAFLRITETDVTQGRHTLAYTIRNESDAWVGAGPSLRLAAGGGSASPIPEPGSAALMLLGLMVLVRQFRPSGGSTPTAAACLQRCPPATALRRRRGQAYRSDAGSRMAT